MVLCLALSKKLMLLRVSSEMRANNNEKSNRKIYNLRKLKQSMEIKYPINSGSELFWRITIKSVTAVTGLESILAVYGLYIKGGCC